MHKKFTSENTIKVCITVLVLVVCWVTLSPTFAIANNQEEEHRIARVIEHVAEMKIPSDKGLTKEQVHDIMQGRLAMMGNTNLKVGSVTQVDKEIVAVDIVTQDNSMVKTMNISTRTGHPYHAKRRLLRMSYGEFGNRTSRLNRNRHGHGFGPLSAVMISQNRELDLTVEQVRTLIEGRLILLGNNRLKMGSVEIINEKTITAEIVTVDNSLVVRSEIDRKTGRINYGI